MRCSTTCRTSWPCARGGCSRPCARSRCGARRASITAWARPRRIDLGTLDVVLMRQDPPFDLAYITATHLLEHIQATTLVVNDPVAVRNAPEKLLVTHFPDLMPPTLITADRGEIAAFRAEHGDIILKPLFGNGGAGVFQPEARRRQFQRAAGDVRAALARADRSPALPARGAPGRQAHHPGRRRAGGRRQPRAARRARRAPTCMSAAGREEHADAARARDLRRHRARPCANAAWCSSAST